MSGFHQISISTFIRNLALYRNVKEIQKIRIVPEVFKVLSLEFPKTKGLLLAA